MTTAFLRLRLLFFLCRVTLLLLIFLLLSLLPYALVVLELCPFPLSITFVLLFLWNLLYFSLSVVFVLLFLCLLSNLVCRCIYVALSVAFLFLFLFLSSCSVVDTLLIIGGEYMTGSGGKAPRICFSDHALQTLGKHGQRPF